jgi:hypothetical protein
MVKISKRDENKLVKNDFTYNEKKDYWKHKHTSNIIIIETLGEDSDYIIKDLKTGSCFRFSTLNDLFEVCG